MKKNKMIASVLAMLCVMSFSGCENNKSENDATSDRSATTTTTVAETEKVAEITTAATAETSSQNSLMTIDFQVSDVMSGDNSTKLGEYGYISISKEQLKAVTMEEYDEFCTKRVEDSGYNWVSIICDDGTGICFAGSLPYCASYGEIDEEGAILQSIGTIMSNFDGTYTYTAD